MNEGIPTVKEPVDLIKVSLLQVDVFGLKDPSKKESQTFEKNLHYSKRYKQRNIEDNFNTKVNSLTADQDPRIKYMKKCISTQESALPIFDKVIKKTLCLQDYKLNDG